MGQKVGVKKICPPIFKTVAPCLNAITSISGIITQSHNNLHQLVTRALIKTTYPASPLHCCAGQKPKMEDDNDQNIPQMETKILHI